MGTTYSDEEWQRNMEHCEDALLEYSGVQSRITKGFTYIEMDSKPFRVRTLVVEPEIKSKNDYTYSRKV